MTCEHCCGAEQFFDQKEAKKKLRQYRKKGATGSTRVLLEMLRFSNEQDRSLLDIGGGIGALQWDFLRKSGMSTTDIDASGAYIKVAGDYAIENSWEDRVRLIKADFIDVAPEVETHTYVTLDKVVCCYPDYQSLLGLATSKANYRIGLTFPIGGPVSKMLNVFATLYLRLSGNPFRSFVHPPKMIKKEIEDSGFKLVSKKIKFPWHVQLYEKVV